MNRTNFIYSILFVFLWTTLSFGQQEKTLPNTTLSSPYDAVTTHLYYLQSDNYEPAKSAKVMNDLKPAEAKALAIKLKQILNGKGLWVALSTVPTDSAYVDDKSRNRFTLFPDKLPEIYVERIDEQWFYSRETIEKIPELHDKIYPLGTDVLVNLVPQFGQQKFLGLFLWQYLGLLLLLVSCFFAHFILKFFFKHFVQFILSTRLSKAIPDATLVTKVARMASLLLVVIIAIFLLPIIQLPVRFSMYIYLGLSIFRTVFLISLLIYIADLILTYVSWFAKKTSSTLDDQLMPLVRKVVKVGLVLLGVIQVLSLLNVNITALIAGVSIGGLAIALAAKDTVQNLIGSLMIFVDQPFQIGDWINTGTVVGTVEEVGFRSTRVRASDTSIIAVPNGKLADMVINNVGARLFRKYTMPLQISLTTSPEVIEQFIPALVQLIVTHPNTRKEGYRVSLSEITNTHMEIGFVCFFTVNSADEEAIAKQELILAVLRLSKILGIQFAYPASAVYLHQNVEPTKAMEMEDRQQKIDDFLNDFKNRL